MSAYQSLDYSTGPGDTCFAGKLRVTSSSNGLDDIEQVVVVLNIL